MAVSTGVNDMLLDEVFGIFTAAEQIMLQKVAKRVKRGATTPGWNEQKLNDVQSLRTEVEQALAKIHGTAMTKATKAIISAHLAGRNKIDTDLKLPKTALKNTGIPWHIQRLVLEANGIMKGASVQILRDTVDIYKAVQTDSSALLLTGTQTRLDASQRMLNTFAAKGITGFVDRAGRRWEMASYAEMAVRTVSSRAALQGHIDRSTELGHDLMVVSSFGKTCPLCAPWEGKPISISGKTPGYPTLDFVKSAGLFHPNCRHTLLAYFPGITELPQQTPNDDQAYDNMQVQRYNERQIRQYKRQEAVAMTPQAQQEASGKVRIWQQRQRDHIAQTGLTRRYHREGIKNRAGNPAQAMFGKHTVAFDNDQQMILGQQAIIKAMAPATALPSEPTKIVEPIKPKAKPAPQPQPTQRPAHGMTPAQLKALASRRGITVAELEAQLLAAKPDLQALQAAKPLPTSAFDPSKYSLVGNAEEQELLAYADKLWNETLTNADIRAAGSYVQTSNSFSMNEMLYTDMYAKAKANPEHFKHNSRHSERRHLEEIDDFSKVIRKGEIPFDMRVVRNTDEDFIKAIVKDLGLSGKDIDDAIKLMNQSQFTAQTATKLRSKLTGIQYENKSFISTSWDPEANAFRRKPIQMEFIVDKGTPGLVTQNIDESEIVFDKGTKVEIVDVLHWTDKGGNDKLKIVARIIK